jgi:hypothetical protein
VRLARAIVLITAAFALPALGADCARECDDIAKWWAYDDLELTMTSPGQAGASQWHAQFDRTRNDIRIDLESTSAAKPAEHAAVGLVSGRILITRAMDLPRGEEIDALDAPVLTVKLLYAVLSRAFPDGPQSVPASKQVDLHETETGIRFATANASGHVTPPWQARGTVKKASDGHLDIDLRLAGGSADPQDRPAGKTDMRFQGTLAHRAAPVFSESMPLADWKVYGAGDAPPATIAAARAALKRP